MAVTAQEVDIRGTVHNLSEDVVTWTNSSFAGFYYDIDQNLGAEELTFTLSNKNPASAILSDQENNGVRGITYKTVAQDKNFKFKPWGSYKVIGFLATRYFAAYNNVVTQGMTDASETVAYLFDKSKNRNLMTNEQIAKVLMDDNKEITITTNNPLTLADGYKLAIKNVDVDGNKAYVELSKNDQVVDSKVIRPSISNAKMSDETYYYKVDLGDTREIVQIAVHFKNAFKGTDFNIATVDGEFQISDTVTPLKSEQQYDKMSIRSVNPTDMTITMDNKDNQVTLSKNKDAVLMLNIYIKTADQDTINAETPLRYYIYKKYTEPGTYQLRGSVTNLGANEFTYDNTNFAGFYYDIDKNLGKEQMTFKLTGDDPASKTLSDQEPWGITYTTTAQPKNFKFKPWGQYEVIGFLAERYFAAYDNTVTAGMTDAGETVAYLFDKSKNRNLMTNEQIAKVLMDDNKEITITTNNPLTLGEGYKLAIKNVDVKGNKAYVELSKNDQVVDSKAVQPSIDNAKMTDKTYYYKVDLGDTKEIVQIAVHFKNAFTGTDTNIATVDGVFQVSDAVTPLKSEQQYDKMSIRNVNPTDYTITMDNKDNQVTLSKNKDVVLMQNVHIKTADQDTISDATPLRYYIYKAATIEGAYAAAQVAAAAAPVAAPAEAAGVTTEAKPAAEKVTAPAAAAAPVAAAPAASESVAKETVTEAVTKAGAAVVPTVLKAEPVKESPNAQIKYSCTGRPIYNNMTRSYDYEMLKNKSYEVDATIAKNASKEKLSEIMVSPFSGSKNITISSNSILVKLTSDGTFDVKTDSFERQAIPIDMVEGSTYGYWKWNVWPRECGPHNLTILAYEFKCRNDSCYPNCCDLSSIPKVRIPIHVTVLPEKQTTLIEKIIEKLSYVLQNLYAQAAAILAALAVVIRYVIPEKERKKFQKQVQDYFMMLLRKKKNKPD